MQALFSLLQSKHSNRGSLAAQSAHDLYSVCIESVSETDIGENVHPAAWLLNNFIIVVSWYHNALACMQHTAALCCSTSRMESCGF